MTELLLLRHSITRGNQKKRYIGRTDEPLCEEGIALLQKKSYPYADLVFSSPMLRCIQTAQLIYPDRAPEVVPELRECDFGEFEDKNYLELADNPHYQAWIDSGGTLPFPGGESREEFARRSLLGFAHVLERCFAETISRAAVIVHGGTIMSILETWGLPAGDYYSWHVDNGCGYLLEAEKDAWECGQRQLFVRKKIC